ncbi:hypothetical protein ACI2LJ_36050 [Streptomyces sp. NPDC088090]|uniref:hypothetical protein n=1 Tax=Streptomyces sp. NPDC088090 TaxID=3365822 RepID=UPI00384F59BA
MTQRAPECGIPVHLAPEDVDRFTGTPNAAYMVEEEQPCELDWLHGGPHASLVQSFEIPGRNWWVLWESGEPYRIALLPNCSVVQDDALDEDGEPVTCSAYGAHGGDHLWMV